MTKQGQEKYLTLRVREVGALGRFYIVDFQVFCNKREAVLDAWNRIHGDRWEIDWCGFNAAALGMRLSRD
jgi:hypothetical protein